MDQETNRLQATRIFETERSVEEMFEYYSNWVGARTDWTLTGTVDENDVDDETHRAVFARNDFGIVNININALPDGSGSTVNVSFTYD